VALATLVRSIAFDRWITVLASLLLITGAVAARRGRTWGVALTFAQAAAFPVAFLIGIAPPWFCLVGAIGSLPFLLSSRALLRFDKTATRVLAALGMLGGALGAIGWSAFAATVFNAIPVTTPSVYPHHGLIALLTAIVGGALIVKQRPAAQPEASEIAPRARIAVEPEVRVAAVETEDVEAETDDEAERRAL